MKGKTGFTLVEMLVVVAILSVVLLAGTMVFISGQQIFSITSQKARMQGSLRRILLRMGAEVQESGYDLLGTPKFSILNGAGHNNTDVLRFQVPICPCGVNPMDDNGEVKYWGAPLKWGQAGCSEDYPLDQNGKVDICHFPPGNLTNPQNLNVSVNAVKAHLSHGDYLGNCGDCDPDNYNNHWVEYRMNAQGQLIRRVLNQAFAIVNESVVADSVSDFQISLNIAQTVIHVDLTLERTALQGRVLTITGESDFILRN